LIYCPTERTFYPKNHKTDWRDV